MAKAFALSPSVKIRVQSLDFAVPALFASSNFVIPIGQKYKKNDKKILKKNHFI